MILSWFDSPGRSDLYQPNDEDKVSNQVRLMKTICKRAESVAVWLGEAEDDTDTALKVLEDSYASIDRFEQLGYPFGPTPDGTRLDSTSFQYYSLTLSSTDAPECKALRKLLSSPWFGRVRTFQEIVLLKKALIMCGQCYMDWATIWYVCASISGLN